MVSGPVSLMWQGVARLPFAVTPQNWLIGALFFVAAVMWIALMLSLRRRHELERLREEYASLFANMQEGFAYHRVITDDEGNPVDYEYLVVNEAFIEMTGVPADIVGHTLREKLPEVAEGEFDWIETYGQVVLSGDGLNMEQEVPELGRRFAISAYCPRRGHFCVLVQDVTERHAMETERNRLNRQLAARNAELQQHRSNLEQEVRRRTEELRQTQEDLLRQERLAMLGRVIATVSHDIRNPLSTIQSSVDLLRQVAGKLPDVAVRAVDRISRSVQRANGIIEELLDHTREPAVSVVETELDTLVAEALDDVRMPAGVSVEKHLDSGVTVSGDALRLQRCVHNVVKNAVEAMEAAGGGHIHLRTFLEDGRPVIVVEDDGPGIPPGDLDHVFEPLFSNKSRGTGLGLSIVRRIMEGHGGGVQIESTVGEGTTVTLSLPPDRAVAGANGHADQPDA